MMIVDMIEYFLSNIPLLIGRGGGGWKPPLRKWRKVPPYASRFSSLQRSEVTLKLSSYNALPSVTEK